MPGCGNGFAGNQALCRRAGGSRPYGAHRQEEPPKATTRVQRRRPAPGRGESEAPARTSASSRAAQAHGRRKPSGEAATPSSPKAGNQQQSDTCTGRPYGRTDFGHARGVKARTAPPPSKAVWIQVGIQGGSEEDAAHDCEVNLLRHPGSPCVSIFACFRRGCAPPFRESSFPCAFSQRLP